MSARTLSAVVLILSALATALMPSMTAEAQTTNVTVLVLDADGEPLVGASVGVQPKLSDAEAEKQPTDDEGRARFSLSPGVYVFTASARDHDAQTRDVVVGATGQEERFALNETKKRPTERADLRLDVEDEDGDAVEGATVTVTTWTDDGRSETFTGTTGSDGKLEMEIAAARGNLHVRHNGYEPGWADFDARDGSASVSVVVAERPRTDASVEGRVTDEDGDPVEGATVVVRRDCCYGYAAETKDAGGDGAQADEAVAESRIAYCCYAELETKTDADGRYEIDVYSGDITIEARKKGFAVETRRINVDSDETATADLVLHKVPPRDAIVSGRVVDAETGAPIPNAGVNLNNLAWSDWGWASTDATGRFELKTYPGYTQIWVHAYGGIVCAVDVAVEEQAPESDPAEVPADDAGDESASEGASTEPAKDIAAPCHPGPGPERQYYAYVVQLDLESGSNDLDVELEPKPAPTVALVGYVVDDAKDEGIPRAWVSVRNEDTGEWGNAQTDRDGSFRIMVRPGRLVIDANANGYFGRSEVFDVRDGENLVRHDVALREGSPRYVPWEDREGAEDAPRPAYAYAEEKAVAEDADSSAARDGFAASGTGSAARTSMASSDSRGRGEASYAGEGGGLGPYRPANVNAGTKENLAPAGGAALAIVAGLGAALLAFARLRRN